MRTDELGEVAVARVSWTDALEEQFGNVPWWVMSALVHMAALFLAALITVSQPRDELAETVIKWGLVEECEYEPEKPVESQVKSHYQIEAPQVAEHPIIPHEDYEIEEEFQTDNNTDRDSSRGEEDKLSDIPLGRPGVFGNIGIASGGSGVWGLRGDGGCKRTAIIRGGGNPKVMPAVKRSLAWLARHQEPDGHWAIQRWEGSVSEECNVGVTALGLLAFLADGHTEKEGEYRATVRRAVAYLISRQNADGSIGNNRSGHGSGSGYNHAIAGLAIAEAYGMAEVPRTGTAAQKAADYSVKVHQQPGGAWRYTPKSSPDTSVTGWFVMQLKSAMMAKLTVDPNAFKGAICWLDRVTDMPGSGGAYVGTARYTEDRNPSANMTAVGALCRQLMKWKREDPVLVGAADHLLDRLPSWDSPGTGWAFYYWYYGTLVMFHMGGNWWKSWNAAMRDMFLDNQRRGDPEIDGSWDPIHDGRRGGRAYSTALAALCLEVYFRYLPMYKG